jgi:hypothetical protein
VPAAAVTPAPIAYIKVVAVKKLVVGCLSSAGRRRSESRVHAFALGVVVSKPDSLYGRTTSPEWWSVVRSQSGVASVGSFVCFFRRKSLVTAGRPCAANPVRAAPPVNRPGCPSPGVSGGRQRLL